MSRLPINQTRLVEKRQFILALRDEYHNKKTDLWTCFIMYINFLSILGCKYLIEMNYWQREDYKKAINGYKTMWHRSRRAGKSLGLSVIGVFFCIINFGYRANQGKVVWRAPRGNQLGQAAEWFKKNPFVNNVKIKDGWIMVMESEPIDIKPMTEGNVASIGASVYIIDEAKKIKKGHQIYDEALESYGMFAEGDLSQKRMISASTGARLTLFHTQYISGEWDYCRHTYKECSWITEEFVQSERDGNPNDPYYVKQEYECVWVARGDTAFQNVYVVDMVNKIVTHGADQFHFGDNDFFHENWKFPPATHAGCDFNGPKTGHYVTCGSMDLQNIYVNHEYKLKTVEQIKPFGEKYLLEIESGPLYNIPYAKECVKKNVKCFHQNWDQKVIAERLYILDHKNIIINARTCQYTVINLEEAVTDETSVFRKLKKSTTQHGLDCVMHQVHDKTMVLTSTEIETNLQEDVYAMGGFGNL